MRTRLVFTFIFSLFTLQSAISQSSIVGHWEGAISIQGQELVINVDFTSSGDTLKATIDIPQQNAKSLPLREVRYQPPSVHFELPAGPGLAVFEGERKDDAISGSFTQAGMSGTFSLQRTNADTTEIAEEPSPELRPIVGLWDGAIDAMGHHLGMQMTFKTRGGKLLATVDIPEQNGYGMPLKNVSFGSSKVHCELPAGPGVAVFDGILSGDSVKGVFAQSGITGSFFLVRGKKVPRKVEAQEQVPYKQEELVFNNDTVKFTGTLTLPDAKGPHPAVIMITGSGAQNRDEELFGFKPFKVIADHFTRNGIAVLRYDDRGVGGSTGSVSKSTTADFAKDVLSAIHFLQSRKDINPKQIGVCGHSEGGIVGPLAASESPDVAFVICMAGTGVDGATLLLAQTEAIMRADSSSEQEIRTALTSSEHIYQQVISGGDTARLRQELRTAVIAEMKSMTDVQRKAITNEEEFINVGVEARMQSLGSPWFRYFLTYNPALTLERVQCPVLALFGGLDTQVPAKLNEDAMETAFRKSGNKDHTFRVFPTANHLFLSAKTGSPSEYSSLKKEFVPGFLDTMTDWILKRVTLPK